MTDDGKAVQIGTSFDLLEKTERRMAAVYREMYDNMSRHMDDWRERHGRTAFDFTSAAASLDEPAKPSKRINEMDLDDYRRGINRIWRTPEK